MEVMAMEEKKDRKEVEETFKKIRLYIG